MTVLHVDGYCVGANINFAGDKAFLVAACGMSTFAVAEPVAKLSAETYAQPLMMIMLRFGLAHMVVLDKDSKCHDTFKQSCQLLYINTHTAGLPISYTVGRRHNFCCRGPILIPRPDSETSAQTTRADVLDFFVKPKNRISASYTKRR